MGLLQDVPPLAGEEETLASELILEGLVGEGEDPLVGLLQDVPHLAAAAESSASGLTSEGPVGEDLEASQGGRAAQAR